MSYAYTGALIALTTLAFIIGGFLEWDSARTRIRFLENDNADLENALLLSYQENEAMREILLARTPRQEK